MILKKAKLHSCRLWSNARNSKPSPSWQANSTIAFIDVNNIINILIFNLPYNVSLSVFNRVRGRTRGKQSVIYSFVFPSIIN